METIASWINLASNRLTGDTPALDAQVFLAHVLARPRAWVLAHPEEELTEEQYQHLAAGLARLQAGEPLPYVLGHWEFFGREFLVTADVLIPRPETELLVEQALGWLKRHPSARRALDVGTGSGCIAVSLAAELPDLRILACDISPAALQVARCNAEKHSVSKQIDFLESDLLAQFDLQWDTSNLQLSTFNLIIANLPYIPTATLHGLAVYRSEPTLALDGGVDGLDLIRKLMVQSPPHLAPHSLLLLEIEQRQGQAAHTLARDAFPQAEVDILQDLSGHARILRVATRDVGYNS